MGRGNGADKKAVSSENYYGSGGNINPLEDNLALWVFCREIFYHLQGFFAERTLHGALAAKIGILK